MPVARDSVTSPTPKPAVACMRAAESTLEAKPTIQPMKAMSSLEPVSLNADRSSCSVLTSRRIWWKDSNCVDPKCHSRPHIQQRRPYRSHPLLCSDLVRQSQSVLCPSQYHWAQLVWVHSLRPLSHLSLGRTSWHDRERQGVERWIARLSPDLAYRHGFSHQWLRAC